MSAIVWIYFRRGIAEREREREREDTGRTRFPYEKPSVLVLRNATNPQCNFVDAARSRDVLWDRRRISGLRLRLAGSLLRSAPENTWRVRAIILTNAIFSANGVAVFILVVVVVVAQERSRLGNSFARRR